MKDLVSRARLWVVAPFYRDMTVRQIAMLGILCDEPGPHTVRGIAAQLKVAKPVITRAMSTFEHFGLAQRHNDPADKRSVLLQATNLGRQVRIDIAGVTA